MSEIRFDTLGMRGPGAEAGAERRPERHRHRVTRPVMVPGHDVDDLVERGRDEVGELILHRPQPQQRRTCRQAGEPGLGHGRVYYAAGPELVQKSLGDLEGTAELADVLTDDENVRIGLHLAHQGLRYGIEVGHLTVVSLHIHPAPLSPGQEGDLRAPSCAPR